MYTASSCLRRTLPQSIIAIISGQVILAVLMLLSLSVMASANSKYAGIVIDAKTGKTLYASSADAPRYPASLTKMMTLYMVFEALDRGRITKKTRIRISKNAAAEQPSKLGIPAGKTISVDQAIQALVTKSANDVSTAIAEHLGKSESDFARQMTRKARSMGMSRTTFRNAHGLPNSKQKTTARDMARLGLALREHYPHHYHYFSRRSFKFGKARYGNHNRLLGTVSGVDGIKTGYIRASGFNLVTSVRRDGRSIVAVVMGGKTGASRNAQMKKLIARYLPKASKRGGGQLIAKGPATNVPVRLPKTGPVPRFRDEAGTEIALAYAKTSKAVTFPIPADRPLVGKDALIAGLKKQRAMAVKPAAKPASVEVDTIVTASTQQPSGWVVQIGATPTRQAAEALLSEAQTRTGGLVTSASAFTAVTERNGQQLHRARFAGFSGKSQAWSACKQLKKKGYGCWATQQ